MKVNREACKADGLTDAEMDFIDKYLDTHSFDSTAALVKIGLGSVTIAEAAG
jgi:hypothetical protein